MRFFQKTAVIAVALILVGQGCVGFGGNEPATSGAAGMYLSTDQGDSWRQIAALPTAEGVKSIGGVSVYRIIQDPLDTHALYLASRGNGLFFTYDDGASWQRVGAPLNNGFIYDLAIHPADNCTLYAPLGAQLYQSTDCGRTWTEVYRESRSGINIIGVTFDQYAPQRILIAQSNGDILQSFDSGVSWSVLRRFKFRIVNLISDPLQPNVYFVTTRNNGLLRSIDGGQTWQSLQEALSDFSGGLEFRRLYMHPSRPGELYWISTYGVLKSIDNGDSWTPLSIINPPGSVNIYGFAISPDNDNEIYYTATPKGSVRTTFYRSVDAGSTWTTKRLPTGQIPTAMHMHPDHGDWIYLGFTIPSN